MVGRESTPPTSNQHVLYYINKVSDFKIVYVWFFLVILELLPLVLRCSKGIQPRALNIQRMHFATGVTFLACHPAFMSDMDIQEA